jgi:hypothetical protein
LADKPKIGLEGTLELSQMLQSVQTYLDTMAQLETSTEGAAEVSDTLSTSLSGVEENTQTTESSTFDLNMALMGLNQGMEVVNKAMGALGQAYDATVGKTIDYAMEVDDLSRILGTNAAETSTIIQIADDFRVSTSALEVASRKLAKEGLTLTLDTIKDLSIEYQAIQDPAARNVWLMDQFGRSGFELGKILEQDAAALDASAESAKKLGLVLSESDVAAADAARMAIDNLKDAYAGLLMKLGTLITPAVAAFMAGLAAWVELLADGIDNLNTEVQATNWDKQKTGMLAAARSAEEYVKAIFASDPALAGMIENSEKQTGVISEVRMELIQEFEEYNRGKQIIGEHADAMREQYGAYMDNASIMASYEIAFRYANLSVQEGTEILHFYTQAQVDNVLKTSEQRAAQEAMNLQLSLAAQKYGEIKSQERELVSATDALRQAELSWSQSVGEKVIKAFEDRYGPASQYLEAIRGVIDATAGTDLVKQKALDDAIASLVKNTDVKSAEGLEAFASGLQSIIDTFKPDALVAQEKTVAKLVADLDGLKDAYTTTVTVNVVYPNGPPPYMEPPENTGPGGHYDPTTGTWVPNESVAEGYSNVTTTSSVSNLSSSQSVVVNFGGVVIADEMSASEFYARVEEAVRSGLS